MNDDLDDDGPSGEGGSDHAHGEPSQEEVQSSGKSSSSAEATAEDQSTKPSSPSSRVAAKGTVPEVPRWRYVDKASLHVILPTLIIGPQVYQHGEEKLWILHCSCRCAS